jgi:chemotaxis protein MotB
MTRRHKRRQPDNRDRWLLSYADFITLLFAFFVVMYSVSSVNEGKYRVLSDSIVSSFHDSRLKPKPFQNEIPVKALPLGQAKKESAEADEMYDAAKQIIDGFKPLLEQGMVSVQRRKGDIEIEIRTSILFPSGSAQLSTTAQPVLVRLAEILGPLPNRIRVEGYTDTVPIASEIYPSNWELSSARAASVVRLFTAQGLHPERLSVIGYGENRPVADNSTEEGRIRNRRIVVVVTASDGPDQENVSRSLETRVRP